MPLLRPVRLAKSCVQASVWTPRPTRTIAESAARCANQGCVSTACAALLGQSSAAILAVVLPARMGSVFLLVPPTGANVVGTVTVVRGTVATASAVAPARSASAMGRARHPVPVPQIALAVLAAVKQTFLVPITARGRQSLTAAPATTATVLPGHFVMQVFVLQRARRGDSGSLWLDLFGASLEGMSMSSLLRCG